MPAGEIPCRQATKRLASPLHEPSPQYRASTGAQPIGRTWLRASISAFVLALVFYRIGFEDVIEICLRASPGFLIAALALYLFGQILSATRWFALARGIGFSTPLLQCIRFYFIGMFFGLAIPSTLGSDGARTVHLGAKPPGAARALSSVVFDRWIGLMTLVAIAVVALVIGPSGELPATLVAVLLAMGAALLALWFFARPLAARLPKGPIRRLIEEDLSPYFSDRRLLWIAAGLSLVVHGLQILAQKLLTDALGLSVPLEFVAIYHPLVVLAAAIPITIGGFGLREAAYAYLLPLAGIASQDAVALALLWWAIGAIGGLAGGALYATGNREPPESRG